MDIEGRREPLGMCSITVTSPALERSTLMRNVLMLAVTNELWVYWGIKKNGVYHRLEPAIGPLFRKRDTAKTKGSGSGCVGEDFSR